MSSHINFGNAFVKKFYTTSNGSANGGGYFPFQRTLDNPSRKWDYEYLHEGVPADCRRVYLIIQNQSEEEIKIYLEKSVPNLLGYDSPEGSHFLILYSKQSISFDNYNGAISINSDSEIPNGTIFVAESFA